MMYYTHVKLENRCFSLLHMERNKFRFFAISRRTRSRRQQGRSGSSPPQRRRREFETSFLLQDISCFEIVGCHPDTIAYFARTDECRTLVQKRCFSHLHKEQKRFRGLQSNRPRRPSHKSCFTLTLMRPTDRGRHHYAASDCLFVATHKREREMFRGTT